MAEITSVATTWLPDDTATISGSGFGVDTGYVNLVFENLGRILECEVTDWTDTSITVTLLADGFVSDEAVYLEVIGPNTGYFAARSDAAVTGTPEEPAGSTLPVNTWVTVSAEAQADLEPAPPVSFLMALGQVRGARYEGDLQYEIRWYPFNERDPLSYVYEDQTRAVGGLTLSRAFASGLLGESRLPARRAAARFPAQ